MANNEEIIEEEVVIRVLYFTEEFNIFFKALDEIAQKQVDKVINITAYPFWSS